MHEPYEYKLKHPPDFRVSYRFYKEAEGGRKSIPRQGYRSDFWYYNEDFNPYTVYMIWPEFEDDFGNVITDLEKEIKSTGTASMWVIDPNMRKIHRGKIKVGLKGHFMEGSRRVAVCTVIEILGLKNNPDL